MYSFAISSALLQFYTSIGSEVLGQTAHRNSGIQNAIHVALDARKLYICKIFINKSIYCVRFAQQCHIISLLRGGKKKSGTYETISKFNGPKRNEKRKKKHPTKRPEKVKESERARQEGKCRQKMVMHEECNIFENLSSHRK